MPIRVKRPAIAQSKRKSPLGPPFETWTGEMLDLEGIGHGISGMVLIIDKSRVIKVSFGTVRSERDMDTERRAYHILAQADKSSAHILKCFELDNPRGLVLERCEETVRHRLQSIPAGESLSHENVQRWATQAAESLAFLHDHKIIHADVGCHNMLLDARGVLKLCDFAGSSVEGSRASTNYEIWSRLPSKRTGEPTITSDLFALGSALYEMATREIPYEAKHRGEVRALYEQEQFPSVKNVPVVLGDVITKCWMQKYPSAADVVDEIDPQQSICCGVQAARTEESAATPSLTGESSSKYLPSPPPKVPGSLKKRSMSSSSTSSSSSSSFISVMSSNSPNPSSLERLSIKSPMRDQGKGELANSEERYIRRYEKPKSRSNKVFVRRKTRHRLLFLVR